MHKRKATPDIRPNERDENPAIRGTTRASTAKPGPLIGTSFSTSQQYCNPMTIYTQNSMKKMAEFNNSFCMWMNSCVKDDPSLIIPHIHIDERLQEQALVNDEKEQGGNSEVGVVDDLGWKRAEPIAESSINNRSVSFSRPNCTKAAASAEQESHEQESHEQESHEQESNENKDYALAKYNIVPVVEEGAVYAKRCKIFFYESEKRSYDDRGIGYLFVKPVESSNRHQLIVRSENGLHIHVNVLLSPSISIKKMSEKDVQLVLVPMPGSDVRIVLIRVKGGVDETVETLTNFCTN